MGTIEQKLNKIIQTKRRLKNNINSLGGELTESNKFSDYPLALSQLYSRLPKTTYQEGTNINLGKTLKAVVQYEDDKVMYGDTQQDSTNGYNLLNLRNSNKNLTVSGLTFVQNNDLSYNVTGTATAETVNAWFKGIYSAYNNFTNWESFDKTLIITSLTPGTYYLNGCYIYYVCEDNTKGTRQLQGSFTLTKNAHIVGVRAKSAVVGQTYNETIYPAINSGSTLQPYEPYTNGASPNPDYPQPISVVTGTQEVVVKNGNNEVEATYTIHLGSLELAKIGTYQDYIYFDVDEGKWYKKKAIEKLILNGTENWNNTYTAFGLSELINKSIASSGGLCNYFIYDSRNSGMTSLTNFKFAIQSISGKTKSSIYILYTDITSVEDFKTWLSTHNTIVYYPLETSTDVEITDTTLIQDLDNLLAMMSVEGTTIIEVSGNLAGSLNVRAVKGE